MKKVYIFEVILGLTLGCLFVDCTNQKGEKQYNESQYNFINEDYIQLDKAVEEPQLYEYRLTITDAEELLRTSNIQRGWRDEPPLNMTTVQIKALNGIYEWQSTICFKTRREMFDYICENFKEMQKYKVSSAPMSQESVELLKRTNIYDEYQYRFDEYLDDPEDEIRFDPEVFDFQDD